MRCVFSSAPCLLHFGDQSGLRGAGILLDEGLAISSWLGCWRKFVVVYAENPRVVVVAMMRAVGPECPAGMLANVFPVILAMWQKLDPNPSFIMCSHAPSGIGS